MPGSEAVLPLPPRARAGPGRPVAPPRPRAGRAGLRSRGDPGPGGSGDGGQGERLGEGGGGGRGGNPGWGGPGGAAAFGGALGSAGAPVRGAGRPRTRSEAGNVRPAFRQLTDAYKGQLYIGSNLGFSAELEATGAAGGAGDVWPRAGPDIFGALPWRGEGGEQDEGEAPWDRGGPGLPRGTPSRSPGGRSAPASRRLPRAGVRGAPSAGIAPGVREPRWGDRGALPPDLAGDRLEGADPGRTHRIEGSPSGSFLDALANTSPDAPSDPPAEARPPDLDEIILRARSPQVRAQLERIRREWPLHIQRLFLLSPRGRAARGAAHGAARGDTRRDARGAAPPPLEVAGAFRAVLDIVSLLRFAEASVRDPGQLRFFREAVVAAPDVRLLLLALCGLAQSPEYSVLSVSCLSALLELEPRAAGFRAVWPALRELCLGCFVPAYCDLVAAERGAERAARAELEARAEGADRRASAGRGEPARGGRDPDSPGPRRILPVFASFLFQAVGLGVITLAESRLLDAPEGYALGLPPLSGAGPGLDPRALPSAPGGRTRPLPRRILLRDVLLPGWRSGLVCSGSVAGFALDPVSDPASDFGPDAPRAAGGHYLQRLTLSLSVGGNAGRSLYLLVWRRPREPEAAAGLLQHASLAGAVLGIPSRSPPGGAPGRAPATPSGALGDALPHAPGAPRGRPSGVLGERMQRRLALYLDALASSVEAGAVARKYSFAPDFGVPGGERAAPRAPGSSSAGRHSFSRQEAPPPLPFAYVSLRLPAAGEAVLAFDLWPGAGAICFALVNAVQDPPRAGPGPQPREARLHVGFLEARAWREGDPPAEPQFRAPRAAYRWAVEEAVRRGSVLAGSLRGGPGAPYDYEDAAGSPECLVAPEGLGRPGSARQPGRPRSGRVRSASAREEAVLGLSTTQKPPESLGGLASSLYAETVRAVLAAYERPQSVSRLAESVYDAVLEDLEDREPPGAPATLPAPEAHRAAGPAPPPPGPAERAAPTGPR